MKLSQKALEVLSTGTIKIRVNRSGMFQHITFKIKTLKLGNVEYYVLFTERTIGLTELAKIAEEIGLPVEAPNGTAFPKGTSAMDFKKES
jgi:hypothetical protein